MAASVEGTAVESARQEKPRRRGRPPKHATSSHEPRDHELKVAVEGVSAVKGSMTSRSRGMNPTCCIVVPHRLLLAWRQQVLSSQASYISLLNESITNHMICVSASCVRLEQRFVKRAGEIFTKTSAAGRVRQQILEKSTTFTLFEGDLVDCLQLSEEIDNLSDEIGSRLSVKKLLNFTMNLTKKNSARIQ